MRRALPMATSRSSRSTSRTSPTRPPNTPGLFGQEWKPEVDIHLQTESRRFAPGTFEVALAVTATVKLEERIAFLAEVKLAGAFRITGLTDDELGPTLGSLCPSILYPYAREVLTDLSCRGGFPQLVLSPVNFEALYLQQRDAAMRAQPGAEGAEGAEAGRDGA